MEFDIPHRPSSALLEVTLDAGERCVAATPPRFEEVAWTGGLSASRQRDDLIKSTLLGGKGFVTHFSGDGRVWLQTRDPVVFRSQAGGE